MKRSEKLRKEMDEMGIGIGGRHCTIQYEYLNALLEEWKEDFARAIMEIEEIVQWRHKTACPICGQPSKQDLEKQEARTVCPEHGSWNFYTYLKRIGEVANEELNKLARVV